FSPLSARSVSVRSSLHTRERLRPLLVTNHNQLSTPKRRQNEKVSNRFPRFRIAYATQCIRRQQNLSVQILHGRSAERFTRGDRTDRLSQHRGALHRRRDGVAQRN